jgi:oligopeptide/dipeptide ABC transporter ATP-binding protein
MDNESITRNLLSVHNLHTQFATFDGVVKAVSGVSFEIAPSQSLALVGETGCGKSVTAYSILRLIYPPGKITKGEVVFKGENLLKKSEHEMSEIRGSKISMIFQEPMTSLNPVFTVGDQLVSVLMRHKKMNGEEALQHATKSIESVRISDPERIVKQYPHELSGGMRQRVLIAMALSLSPELIICDEPTTYLDVTVQAQILRLIKDLQVRLHASMLLITHNLGVVAHYCDTVAVMYAGSVVEIANVKTLFNDPKHPYVQGLLKAIPSTTKKAGRLESIPGSVPNLIHPPTGCKFHPRCPYVMPVCKKAAPQLGSVGGQHNVACYLHSNIAKKEE